MKKLFIAGLSLLLVTTAYAATSNSDSIEVISPQVQKMLGTWEGDVVFNNEKRFWTLTRKRDYTVQFNMKVCDTDNSNCKEWTEEGAWNADENYYYAITNIDENGNPLGYVYKYEFLENGCIDYLMVATSFKEHKENSGKSYNEDDYVNNYRFQDCKVR